MEEQTAKPKIVRRTRNAPTYSQKFGPNESVEPPFPVYNADPDHSLTEEAKIAVFVALAETKYRYGRVNFTEASNILRSRGIIISREAVSKLWNTLSERAKLSEYFSQALEELYYEEKRQTLAEAQGILRPIIQNLAEALSDKEILREKIAQSKDISSIARALEGLEKILQQYKEYLDAKMPQPRHQEVKLQTIPTLNITFQAVNKPVDPKEPEPIDVTAEKL